MRIIQQKLGPLELNYPLEKIAPLSNILFIDIETTGFTAKNSYLYLIGTAFHKDGIWFLKQWFAENYEDEASILSSFLKFLSGFSHIIHFNGNNFDLPYLMEKCKSIGLSCDFSQMEGIDLYRRIAPYKTLLRLTNCKQKSLEQFLDIGRDDPFHGGELISVYYNYVNSPTDLAFEALTLHNAEDMKGMLGLTPLLSYYDLFHGSIKAKKVQANHYCDITGNEQQELLIKLSLPSPLPKPFSCSAEHCYFKAAGIEGTLRIPLFYEEMKYFYSNYKNYYYLPTEDTALHKSVASYVDKGHRIQASASNCYTRKLSHYLPQWEILIEPFFKRTYTDQQIFFELTEEIKKERSLFSKYASHVLHMIISKS